MTTADPLSLAQAQRLASSADTILLRATRAADLETPIGALLRLDDARRRTRPRPGCRRSSRTPAANPGPRSPRLPGSRRLGVGVFTNTVATATATNVMASMATTARQAAEGDAQARPGATRSGGPATRPVDWAALACTSSSGVTTRGTDANEAGSLELARARSGWPADERRPQALGGSRPAGGGADAGVGAGWWPRWCVGGPSGRRVCRRRGRGSTPTASSITKIVCRVATRAVSR